ncbi:potassium channel family protein [Janibacter sp. GXQ6167]|uniref:potassium channel family protein n=1 Tax=Janibacter sp. GXQ6167 TaxID=3240791 RepID=UPI0035250498
MQRRPLLSTSPSRTALACALIIAVYYLVPLEADRAAPVRLVGALIAIAGLAAITVRQLKHSDEPLGRLVTLLVVVCVGFATGFYTLANTPGQFEGLHTRTDALYFTIVTMATVGYGDIHPVGQAARLLVIAAIVFNLVFVAAIGSTIVRKVRAHQPGGAGGDE